MTQEMRSIDDLQTLLWSFAGHRVMTVAGRTGILNRLAQRAATTEALAGELDLDPPATGKIVRALTALGLVESNGSTYRIREPFIPVFTAGPGDLTPFLEHSHHLYDSWGANLEDWLRGKPWTTSSRGSEGILDFGRAMLAMAATVSDRAVDAIDPAAIDRMLDVGGGLGAYARAFCQKKPGLRATVLDTEAVAELGRKESVSTETEGQIEFIGGDYLETDYGSGYDLVLFANVLHQELPDPAARMVRRGARALIPGGRVAVIDFSIDEERQHNPTGALFAINMRSFGDTHTEPAIRDWMTAAGLSPVTRVDLSPTRWLITGRKPG